MSDNKLAIAGGTPTIPEGPPSWPQTTAAIRKAVQSALDDQSWGKYESHWTEDVTSTLSGIFASEHVQLCSSGTIAVEVALRSVNVKQDDEVLLAGYDFPGNFRAIESIGARPVLIDVVKDGWVVDPNNIASATTKKTKAIVVSHLHGQIADIEAIRDATSDALDSKIAIVEDNCQSPGGSLQRNPLGTFGDVGVLSFGGSKLLSAGRGGAVITNNADVFQRAKIFSNRGNDAFPMSQIQAAMLLPQLSELKSKTLTRSKNADSLIQLTSEIKQLSGLTQLVAEDHLASYYKLPWLLANPTQGGWTREEFVNAIRAEGVAIDTAFRGFTRRSARRCRKSGTLINSQIASQQTVLLHHPVLLEPEETIRKVALAINRVLATSPM